MDDNSVSVTSKSLLQKNIDVLSMVRPDIIREGQDEELKSTKLYDMPRQVRKQHLHRALRSNKRYKKMPSTILSLNFRQGVLHCIYNYKGLNTTNLFYH